MSITIIDVAFSNVVYAHIINVEPRLDGTKFVLKFGLRRLRIACKISSVEVHSMTNGLIY